MENIGFTWAFYHCVAIEVADNDHSLNYGGKIHGVFWCYPGANMNQGRVGKISFDYFGPMILHMDSQSAMALARNPTHHKWSKHI